MTSWIPLIMFAVFVGVMSLVIAVAREAVNIRRQRERATARLVGARMVSSTSTSGSMGVYVPQVEHEQTTEPNG